MNFKKIKNYFNWKIVSILVVSLLLGIISLPEEYQPDFFPEAITQMQVNLGLDLQGGSQLEYSIDLRNVPNANDQRQVIEGVLEVINRRVNNLGVSEPSIYTSNVGGETHVIVELAGISDLDEAKEIVGRTIQLEFKEQNTEPDPNLQETVRNKAQALLTLMQETPENFKLLAEREQRAFPERVTFEETELLFADQIAGENIKNAILNPNLQPGQIVNNLIEDSAGLTMTSSGQLRNQEGFFALQLLERNDQAERVTTTPKEVEASRILITFRGAETNNLEVTRTKEEARTLAQDVLRQTLQDNADFGALALEFSDDVETKENAGRLPSPVREGGSLATNLTNSILSLEEGQINPTIIETSEGFHIVKANTVRPETEETTIETQVKFAKLLYSTAPDEWKSTELTGQYFVRADVTFDQFYLPQVSIQFNAEGARLFEELTQRNIGKRIAIFVGGELISAPNVNERIAGGQAVINGDFNMETARDLARDLNTGAIPAPITLVGQYTIGASLGQEALTQSLNAGFIGILILIVFMTLYYRVPGLIANLALVIYAVMLIFLIKAQLPISLALLISLSIFAAVSIKVINNPKELFWEKTISLLVACFGLFFFTFLLSSPVVLTLAGVAGIVLSIGMAVDGNILIFERIKEEIQDGRPYLSAVQVGFDRAWDSIRDSHFSSLITCAILYYFGTSIIRGFALNLAAGILLSLFTAITVTRVFMLSLNETKLSESKLLMGFSKEAKQKKQFQIMKKSKLWLSLSAVLVTISIISMSTLGINRGLDFQGGTLMDLSFPAEAGVTSEQLNETLANLQQTLIAESESSESIWGNPNIVSSGPNSYIIRLGYIENETYDRIMSEFRNTISPEVEEIRFTAIGPTVSQNLQNKALMALFIALVAIIIYIAFAFRHIPKELNSWKFGACAIIAVTHDVLITLGIFSLFQFEVDALFITAILTIIGFSVHDTIVVFDRVRENLKGFDSNRNTFNQVSNLALNQTLARSINTSFSTLITLLALFLLGAQSISLFVLALIIGILVGTYSSIFIATPVLAYLINRSKVK